MRATPDPAPGSPSGLPSGLVTFLFTDIEGSTKRWERDPASMQAALRRHDTIIRTAIARQSGYVFKTIGDAFCAAFNRPSEAVAAAIDIFRSLAAEDFSAVDGVHVRMALHAGPTDERDGDYFGPPVNRVARLLGAGHGDQILASSVVWELVRGALPSEIELRDLGAHRLKDLERAERIYQIVAPDLALEFPPLRTLNALANNLPSTATSFFGRATEIAEITALLETHRLVTIAGSGGLGKTRTSLHVAANFIDRFPDGVWLIELAPLAQGELIPSAIAQAAGLTLPEGGEQLGSLARLLESKTMLVILDNCEHLVESAANVAAALLRRAPNVKILATSRQALGISGEASYRMPSLDERTGVQLFASRAQATDRRFVLTADNEAAVIDICRRVDGIPLAIELAAARVTIFTPKQLSGKLNERFRLLTGGRRDVLPRQQTLRALIDWSYDLLDAREQRLFERLGIFVNGFLLEGAVAIAGSDVDEFEVLELLGSLVDKSLVLADAQGEQTRYRLLESTRAYALEKLDVAGERNALRGRHLAYLRAHIQRALDRYHVTLRNAELDDAFGSELEDMRAALDWSLDADPVAAGALLTDLEGVWIAIGLTFEGLGYLQRAADAVPESEFRLLARLWRVIARLRGEIWDHAGAFAAASKAIAYARRQGGGVLASALGQFSWAAVRVKKIDEAEAALQEAMAIPGLSSVSQLGRQVDLANVLFARDPAEGSRLYEKLWRENTSLGDSWNWGMALNVSEAEAARGLLERAVSVLNEVLPGMRERADPTQLGQTVLLMSGYLLELGAKDEAARGAREALELLASREPESPRTASAIEQVALSLAERGRHADAATLWGFAGNALVNARHDRNRGQNLAEERLRERLLAALPPPDLAKLKAQGAAISATQAITLALRDD